MIRRAHARREGGRHSREQWRRFAIATLVTVALVVAIGTSPLHDLLAGSGASSHAAVLVAPARDDTPRFTSATPSSTTTIATTTTVPPTTTTVPPTTTTVKLRVPGLGLPPQPTPTPMSLPPTNLAPVFNRIPTTNKVIFLGIDDGMVRDPAVLDLLRQANVPFTMFLVQSLAHAGLDYWQQAQEVGGVVESHTITHPDLTKVSASQLQNEVCGTLDDYQTLFGRRPTLFRPPYGSYNDNVRAVAASCGFKAIVMWKGSTNDGRFDLQDGPQLTPGDIVLMHWRTDLLADLQKVFDTCRQQGFAIASLEDYLPG